MSVIRAGGGVFVKDENGGAQVSDTKLNRIMQCLRNGDYENPELASMKIISLCLLTVLALCVFVFCTRIGSIEVVGDVHIFNEARIAEASELRVGGCMYSKPFFVIKSSIRKNLPMAERISVRKNLFTGKVSIRVEFSAYEYFTEYKGLYYGLDSQLTVTDVKMSRLEFLSMGAAYLELPSIAEPKVGQGVIFSDTIDINDGEGNVVEQGADESRFDFAREFLTFLEREGYADKVNAVFLGEKYNIRMIYDGRYMVYIGKCDSLGTKLEVVEAIIADGTVLRAEVGSGESVEIAKYAVIDVRNPAQASARADNTLNIGDYVIEVIEADTEEADEDDTATEAQS